MSNRKKKAKQVTLSVGDKVELLKKEKGKYICGRIKYIGNIYRKTGIWYGIELDKPIKNSRTSNGEHQKIQYFKCENNKAMFVVYSEINIQSSSNKKSKKKSKSLVIGKKVSVKSVECNGIIKYIGEHLLNTIKNKKTKHNNKQKKKGIIYYGIELEKPVGNNNGKFDANNVQYFKCGKNYGIFVTKKDIGKPYIDYDTNELLLSGYIKNMNDMKDTLDIPMDIIFLCIKFFVIDHKLYNHIFLWYILEENERKYPDYLNSYDAVEVVDISNKSLKRYTFQFDKIDKIKSSVWSRYGLYYNLNDKLRDFMKSYIKQKHDKDVNINSVLIRNGGWDHERGNTQTDCWYFDSNDVYNDDINGLINGYYYNLPYVVKENDADIISKHSFLFDNMNNMMYIISGGGYDDDDNRWFANYGIWKLNLNQINNKDKFKWNRLGCSFKEFKLTPRYAATEIIDYKTRKYMICGGAVDQWSRAGFTQCYQLYYDEEIKGHKLMQLASMKHSRTNHVICKYEIKNRIIVGSGGHRNDIAKICEMYDIAKNRWFDIKCDTHYTYWGGRTSIWIDQLNNNMLYIAGNYDGYGVKYMECIDLRTQKNGWMIQPIHNNDNDKSYKIQWMMT